MKEYLRLRWIIPLMLTLAWPGLTGAQTAPEAAKKPGDPAPAFDRPSHTGATVSLKDYAGKSKLVLVFYRGSW